MVAKTQSPSKSQSSGSPAKSQSRENSFRGYGSFKDGTKERHWEKKGSLLTILIQAGGKWGKHAVVLCLAIFGMLNDRTFDGKGKSLDINWPQCKTNLAPYYFSFEKALLCKYLMSFAIGWPPVALAVLMLMISRDMVQKRLYYGMLKSNCSIVYNGANRPQKDPLIVYILVLSLHVILFLFFLFHTVIVRIVEEDEAKVQSKLGGPSQTVDASADSPMTKSQLMVVISVVLMPLVFYLLDVNSDYNLQEVLVSLSDYSHEEIEPHAVNQVATESGLQSLEVWEDHNARQVFMQRAREVDDSSLTLPQVYDKLIDIGRKEPREDKQEEEMDVFLLQSLWPAPVLLKPRDDDDESRNFRYLFSAYGVFMAVVFAFIFAGLIDTAIDQIMTWRMHPSCVIPAVCSGLNLVVVILIGGKIGSVFLSAGQA